MTDGTFEKVERSDEPMYGPPKLLLCGFPAPAQPKFATVLSMAGLDDVAVLWANEKHLDTTLSTLTDLPDNSGSGQDSTLARAIIVAGITENQLHRLMAICRKSGMQQALWAVLTPNSETWSLGQLLDELQTEREALADQRKK